MLQWEYLNRFVFSVFKLDKTFNVQPSTNANNLKSMNNLYKKKAWKEK